MSNFDTRMSFPFVFKKMTKNWQLNRLGMVIGSEQFYICALSFLAVFLSNLKCVLCDTNVSCVTHTTQES